MSLKRKTQIPGRSAIFFAAALFVLAACGGGTLSPIGHAGCQPDEDESRIWKESRELQLRFDQSGLLYDEVTVTAYTSRVAARIIPGNAAKQINFQIKILKHPIPNAFALPHGALYIHSGMLARMDNEAQLAAVIGHEISHIIRRHTLLTFRNTQQAAGFASTLAVIGAPAGLPGLGVVILGNIGALAALSGYSQGLEEEADAEGLQLMANGGYDPAEAVLVFESVRQYVEQDEIKEPFFFSTHPRLEERKASYQRLVDSQYRGQSGFRGAAEFNATMANVLLENAYLELARGRFAFAQAALEKSLSTTGVYNPRAHFLLAELYRQRATPEEQGRAEEEYQRTIELEPGFAAAHRGLGLLDYKQGRTNLASQHFAKYLELNPAAHDRAYIEQYLRESEISKPQP
jgi:predicted Zn-dependent protease